MSRINLFWYRFSKKFNFGDELNPYLISKLSGKQVAPILALKTGNSIIKEILILLVGFTKSYYNLNHIKEYILGKRYPNYIVGIGSILHHNFSKKTVIWGSGIIDRKLPVNDSVFLAVRGYETVRRLNELGYDTPKQVGDPGLLLPIVYNHNVAKIKGRIGIIPHISHLELMKIHVGDRKNFKIIDFTHPSIEETVDSIRSCELILSSSLHGLIISHAYRIPSLHINFGSPLSGDGVKFVDYFSSVNIEPYDQLNFNKIDLDDLNSIYTIFEKKSNFSLPNSLVIKRLQKGLIDVAPFRIEDKFKIQIDLS